MEKIKELFKSRTLEAGTFYILGNFFIKGINFITLPFFSRMMTTDEFGFFNVFISYESILFVIIGLAIHGSIQSANKEFEGKINEYTSCVTQIYIYSLLIMIFFSCIFSNVFFEYTKFDLYIIICLLLYSFGSSILTLYNARISLDYDYKKYLIVSFISSVGNVFVSFILMGTYFKNERAYGRITGVTIVSVFLAVYILRSFYIRAPFSFSVVFLKFAIKYSLPIVPHGLAQVLLAQFDKIMIRYMIGNAAVGVYSLAGNIQLILKHQWMVLIGMHNMKIVKQELFKTYIIKIIMDLLVK